MDKEFYYFDSHEMPFVFEKQSLSINVLSHDLNSAIRKYLSACSINKISPFNQSYIPEIQQLIGDLCGEMPEVSFQLGEQEYVEINLMATNNCNLNCTYCFAREVFQNKFPGDMSIEVAERSIDVFISRGNLTSVIFMGGEPTLVPGLIERVVNYSIERSISLGYRVPFFPIVTNATLLTKDLIEFIKNNNMELIISYDGSSDSHDVNRVFSSGKGTSDVVINNIKSVKAAGIPLHVDATFTKRHIDLGLSVRDIYKKLIEDGAEDIYIMPVVLKDKTIGFSDEDSGNLFNLFAEASFAAVEYSKDTVIPFSYPRSVLSVLRNNLFRKRVCDAGINSFTIMPNGDIFPCYFLSKEEHCLGNVMKNIDVLSLVAKGRALIGDNLKKQFQRCQNCWAENVCFGCFGPSIQEFDEVSPPPDYFCSILRGLTYGTFLGLIKEWKLGHVNGSLLEG